MPLTFVITAALARAVIGLFWTEAALVAAALGKTDPELASAIVGRREVPERVRRLLNVESGVNEGLVLPVVIVSLAVVSDEPMDAVGVAAALVCGVLLGVAVPAVAGVVLRVLPGEKHGPARDPRAGWNRHARVLARRAHRPQMHSSPRSQPVQQWPALHRSCNARP
jgi:hypothetical protein